MKRFLAPLLWIYALASIYIKYFGSRVDNLFWNIGVRINKHLLEGNNKFLSRFVDFEAYKRNFVTEYMADQGFEIPAITKVVLKNGYDAAIGVHFFAKEHMVIDRDRMSVEPVYTTDLLRTSYFVSELDSERSIRE